MSSRIYFGLSLLALLVVFIVQNATAVDIQLFFWKVSMSRSIMIMFVLIIGFVIGWLSAGHVNKKKRRGNTSIDR